MAQFIPVIKTNELLDGSMKKVKANGKDIMISRVGGKYFAVDNRCPHAGGDLSAGKLEANVVTCPRHGSQWDITNGHVIRWMRTPGAVPKLDKITSYPVKIEGENVLVEV